MRRYRKSTPKPVTFTGTPSGYLRLGQWSAIAERLGLDDRDVDIVRGLIDGETEKAIGERCDLSAGGVHRCIDLMYRRVNVHDRASFFSASSSRTCSATVKHAARITTAISRQIS